MKCLLKSHICNHHMTQLKHTAISITTNTISNRGKNTLKNQSGDVTLKITFHVVVGDYTTNTPIDRDKYTIARLVTRSSSESKPLIVSITRKWWKARRLTNIANTLFCSSECGQHRKFICDHINIESIFVWTAQYFCS